MATEIHGLICGIDKGFVAKEMLKEITGKDFPIDTRTLLDVAANNSNALQNRLQIDVHSMQ